jgi:subtilisin family serine protease
MRVIVQLRSTSRLRRAAIEAGMAAFPAQPRLPGIQLDRSYPAVPVPAMLGRGEGAAMGLDQPAVFSHEPQRATYIVRGEIDPKDHAELLSHDDVVGVFSDPVVEPSAVVCPPGPVGTVSDVATKLAVTALAKAGCTGKGVRLAIVDTGVNLAYLRSHGRKPRISRTESFTPSGVTSKPGAHPVNHGTMCAFDAGVSAPEATLLDHAVLLSTAGGPTPMSGLLSDAVLSYSALLQLQRRTPISRRRPLVVSNSWGMFSPQWDFPVGHPGNYSDNPNHPFNVIVASLEVEGADILFAAGNCGRECPDGRCQFGTSRPICGANSHPKVLSIGGVDVQQRRLGYSSQGPGRLSAQKPDLCGYTHFTGSGVYPEDGGTSAACPVVAGVVAAVRSVYPLAKVAPAQLRTLLQKTASDLGGFGFDTDFGWGVVDVPALLAALAKVP